MLFSEPKIPQCKSPKSSHFCTSSFSALQRAENSSIRCCDRCSEKLKHVSVLFSEPKIPQSTATSSARFSSCVVSVLFSEPKIPQFGGVILALVNSNGFSALQRAENSSIRSSLRHHANTACFSALQRAENSSIRLPGYSPRCRCEVSVLFSEPKIPQSRPSHLRPSIFPTATITLRRS